MLALSIQLLRQQSQTRKVQIFTGKTTLNTNSKVWWSQMFPTVAGDGAGDHLSKWDVMQVHGIRSDVFEVMANISLKPLSHL